MTYQEELNIFIKKYPYQTLVSGGGTFRYILVGGERRPPLVFLNGGMNVSEMWMRYVENLSEDYRILLFDYPMEFKSNQELVVGMHKFFEDLGLKNPVLIGASDGGMIAQIYTQRYSVDVGGLVLISTGGMDEQTLKSLRRKYFFAPIMLWVMKRCNYEKLKPRLIRAGMHNMPKGSDPKDVAYIQDMFETIFRDYKQEKDVHISSLLADVMHQMPVTPETFARLKGRILLILPDKDFFGGEMQKDLVGLMHDPDIMYISGGHMATILQADEYIQKIREFCRKTLKL
ncbi:alpha/beta hydrolase [Pseudoramibacter faecis]|uniref:alpha/beta fold hydrolase n=1 Tax=Pseudoramibacter faecis TaxID=3108534 RepID=UPI002E766276|nr:alpha/beta hydrolase [Pseudoramibacter sp. HA2172]